MLSTAGYSNAANDITYLCQVQNLEQEVDASGLMPDTLSIVPTFSSGHVIHQSEPSSFSHTFKLRFRSSRVRLLFDHAEAFAFSPLIVVLGVPRPRVILRLVHVLRQCFDALSAERIAIDVFQFCSAGLAFLVEFVSQAKSQMSAFRRTTKFSEMLIL